MALPKHHHPHDSKWIAEQLIKLPPAYRERATKAYSEVYERVYASVPLRHQKHGAARREANTRLIEYIKRVLEKQ